MGGNPRSRIAEFSPEALEIMVEAADFGWAETLGVAPNADASLVRRAMTKLALAYHPDKGGAQDQMARINAAYEKAHT
jgi:DnaJ-class molecular chaperone